MYFFADHKSSFSIDGNICTCYDGEVICTKAFAFNEGQVHTGTRSTLTVSPGNYIFSFVLLSQIVPASGRCGANRKKGLGIRIAFNND